MIKIVESKLLQSLVSVKEAPDIALPELVMIGRSNVGKSSFINTICNRKNLAYTSKTPGKTRLINLYQINEDFVLTDLPGYGYARRSQKELKFWQKKIEEYLLNRKQIIQAIQLIDSRHRIQDNDFQMREWLDHYKISTLTILTKIDQIPKTKVKEKIIQTSNYLSGPIIGFSAKTKQGKEDVLKYFTGLLERKPSK